MNGSGSSPGIQSGTTTPTAGYRVPDSIKTPRPDFKYDPGKKGSRSTYGQDTLGADKTPKPKANGKPTRQNLLGEGDDDGSGNGNGNGYGDDDDDDCCDGDCDYYIYYYWCGCPWWHCGWGHYWHPIYWGYCGWDYLYWRDYWIQRGSVVYIQFENDYNFDDYYPSIYTPPALFTDPTSAAIEHLDAGAVCFKEGRYLDALGYFRLATLVDLDFAIPKFAYAHALFALGLYDAAAHEIRQGLSLMQDWVNIGGDLRLMYGDEKDFEEQLAALIHLLRVSPQDEDSLLVLGYVSYFTGDIYLAEKAFKELQSFSTPGTLYVTRLFLDAIVDVKRFLAEQNSDSDVLTDDGLTLEQVLNQ